MKNKEFDNAILTILKQGSLSEFELIKTLQQAPYFLFNDNIFKDELSLFQSHFVIHNTLYRLRDIGLSSGEYDIDTLTTQLRFIPLHHLSSNKDLIEVNRPEVIKLREYYLDWDNFSKTEKDDVLDLLGNFWHSYSRLDFHSSSHDLQQALTAMGFEALPSRKELKSKYKQLSNLYHPDKGGNAEQFSVLQHHYQTIKLFAR